MKPGGRYLFYNELIYPAKTAGNVAPTRVLSAQGSPNWENEASSVSPSWNLGLSVRFR